MRGAARPAAAIIPAPQVRRVRLATLLRFVVLSCIWGSTWIVIKDQIGVVPPAWSVAYRFLAAGVAVAGLCVVLRRPLRLPAAGHGLALAVATLQFALNFNLVYAAEGAVTSGLVALVFALIVVPNAVLARVFLGQRIAPLFVAGGAMGLGGVALLVGGNLGVGGPGFAAGCALAVAAVLCASAGNVLQGTALARSLPLEPLLAASMLYGGLLAATWALATTGAPVVEWRIGYLAGIAYLAVVASALAFTLYYALIREIGPARSAYVNVIVPVVAMTLSTVFEGFAWTPRAALGALLAIGGLAVALRARR